MHGFRDENIQHSNIRSHLFQLIKIMMRSNDVKNRVAYDLKSSRSVEFSSDFECFSGRRMINSSVGVNKSAEILCIKAWNAVQH